MEVFIGTLATTTTDIHIKALLRPYVGEVPIRVIEQQRGTEQPLRYAVANFKSERVARKLIKRLNGITLFGHTLELREYAKRHNNSESNISQLKKRSKPERRQYIHGERLIIAPQQAAPFDEWVKSA